MIKISSSVLLVLCLFCISSAIIVILAGCDEKEIDVPILGSSAGSGPIGGGESQSITLTASPSETIITVGEEAATADITAIVENSIGQAVPDGTAVYWSATNGTLSTTTDTTSNGSSTVTLTFSDNNFTGCSTVTAISGDADASITICVTNQTPTPTQTPSPTPTLTPTPSYTFIVSASNTTIPDGGTSTISVYAATNGVADENLQVTFNASSGFLSASAGVTDASGYAQVTFTGDNDGSSDTTVTITATTTDGRSGSTRVVVTP